MCNNLWLFSTLGAEVTYVGNHIPFTFEHFGTRGVKVHLTQMVQSAAIGSGAAIASQDVLSVPSMAECLANEVLEHSSSPRKTIIWGHYLIPYGLAVISALNLLAPTSVETEVWLTPTGSDIWEIGPQLAQTTQMLLSHSKVSRIITYTKQFAEEIVALFPRTPQIQCILPALDIRRFAPPAGRDSAALRVAFGISDKSFVITSHSNMRPVKCPENVIAIAHEVAEVSDRPVVLMLIGPRIVTCKTHSRNLTIVQTGVVQDVIPYLHLSDAELNCSKHDSFNLSLAESLACGVPCVSTNVVGIAQEIRACEGGYLFNSEETPNRDHSAVRFLLELARSDAAGRAMGLRGSAHIREVLSPSAVSKQFLPLLV